MPNLNVVIPPKFFRGDAVALRCSVRDETSGVVVPFGLISTVQVRVRSTDDPAVLLDKAIGQGVELVDSGTSTYECRLTPVDTRLLAAGKYLIQWRVTDTVNGPYTAGTQILPLQEGAFGA